MDDGADVRFVDAHAEGYGGDYDVKLTAEECALDAVSGARFETCVVGSGGEVFVELGGELFGVFAGLRVDDGWARRCFFEELEGEVGALGLGELYDLYGEVRAAKAGDEDGWSLQVELLGNVLLDDGGGRCGESDDRCRA